MSGPTPGAVAWSLVTRTYDDGYSHRMLYRWADRTAADVADHWRDRCRNHGVPHRWDGDALIREGSASWQGEVTTWVERTTFHDAPADGVPVHPGAGKC